MTTTYYGAYIQAQFPQSRVITSYTLSAVKWSWASNTGYPTEWVLCGSTNGSTWNVLDVKTGGAYTNYFNWQTYTFTNTTSYQYYRWIITKGIGYFNGPIVAMGMLLSDDGGANYYPPTLSSGNDQGYVLTNSPGVTNGGGNWYFMTQNRPSSMPSESYNSGIPGPYNASSGAYSGSESTVTVSNGGGGGGPPATPLYANYWSFTMNATQAIGSYGLGTYDPNMTIYGWYLLGSSDNATWNVIDRRTTSVNYNSAHTTDFTLASPSTPYPYIRLAITAIHNNNNNDAWLYRGGFWIKNSSGAYMTSSNGVTSSEFANPYGTPYLATTTYTGSVGPNLYAGYQYQAGYLTTGALNTLYSGSGYSYTGTVSTLTYLPPSAPSAPTGLSASAGNGSVTISFTAGSNGGSAITNYKYSLDGGSNFTAFSPAVTTSPVSITGLTNGVLYTIKLKAVNSIGDGDASASITATPATIPDAPTNLVASYGGSGAVSISFTPGSNGGQTITNYQYSINCGATFTALSPVDAISPVVITGLTNGVSYCIELKALNSVGAGIASSSVQYTAFGPADGPTNLTWEDQYNGIIRMSFTPGYDQGSAITNYEYSLNGGTTFTTFSPPQSGSQVYITGLNIRTHYSIVLRAVNDAGAGPSSATLNMYYMCFLEGTKILCFNPETNQEEYRAIETLRKGSLVKTVENGYKAIDMIGTSKIYNPGNSVRSKNRLYKCSKENYPELMEDLFITGCHSILVKDISDQEREQLMEFQGKIYITDNHYRLIAAVDKRAEPHASEGVFNIWHLALENDNYYFNYGIYANGLLVETTSQRMMKELSGMDMV